MTDKPPTRAEIARGLVTLIVGALLAVLVLLILVREGYRTGAEFGWWDTRQQPSCIDVTVERT